MSVAIHHPMSVAEFPAWEERQEFRWELDRFQPVGMTGGTVAHELIGGNVRTSLQNRPGSGRCRMLGPTLKIEVAGRIRHPDAFVACMPIVLGLTVVREPVVVFEVISESNSRTDLVAETLTTDDTLRMPEIGIEIPMAAFYTGIELSDETPSS